VYWWQLLRYTVPAQKIARQPGEARARLPVRASPGSLASLLVLMYQKLSIFNSINEKT
jgi:hypothetical protein